MKKIENLPALSTVGKSLFATYEVAGKSYATPEDARMASYAADVLLLLDKLNDWMGGQRYALRHFSHFSTETVKARLKVLELLDGHKWKLKNIMKLDQGGRYVWEHIQAHVKAFQPVKQETQSFVNWFRMDHLLNLFVHRWGPEEQHRNDPDPRADAYAWDQQHR